jgi:hypothetical protein
MSLKFWYSHESVLFFKYVTIEKGFRTAGFRKFSVCGGNFCVCGSNTGPDFQNVWFSKPEV